jgi:DNA-directed RNA polymerase subunit beta
VLMRELQSLYLDIAVHKVNTSDEGSEHVEVDLMAEAGGSDRPQNPLTNRIN